VSFHQEFVITKSSDPRGRYDGSMIQTDAIAGRSLADAKYLDTVLKFDRPRF
jgi:hypothetical protein